MSFALLTATRRATVKLSCCRSGSAAAASANAGNDEFFTKTGFQYCTGNKSSLPKRYQRNKCSGDAVYLQDEATELDDMNSSDIAVHEIESPLQSVAPDAVPEKLSVIARIPEILRGIARAITTPVDDQDRQNGGGWGVD